MLLAGLATVIALGLVEVPPAILHSSVSQAFLLVMTLVLFAYSPVVGIAAIALFAILMFKRNVQKTSQYTKAIAQYSREAAEQQKYQAEPHYPVARVSPPREYSMQPTGVMEHYASPEEVGTYPIQDPRPSTEASHTYTATYRPAEDMGDNTYVAGQPTLEDAKMTSFAY